MKPLDGKTQKIELAKGGMNVDGQFVPKLPPVNPSVKASTLVIPPTVPQLSEPKQPSLPQNALQRASNVANETQTIIQAKTAEAQKRQELLDTLAATGDQASLQSLYDQRLQDSGVNDNLKELKDIQLQLTDMNTASDLTKTRIAGAAGQTMGQAQRELTQEDRENAVRTTGLAARAAVLQGNIETGRALAKDAVEIAYQDRTLNNQSLITQLNEYGKIADEQTKQLVDQAKAEAEAEIKADDEMKAAIADAMVNGASQSEIAELNKQLPPGATPEQIASDRARKVALAQQITARGAGEMRGLQMEQVRASIDSSRASAAKSWQEYDATAEAIKAKQEAIASGAIMLEPEQQDAAMKLSKQFEDESKVFKTQVDAYNRIVTAASEPSAAGDLSLIFAYMKMLDPGSVVREQEFANAQNAAGVPERVRAMYNNALRGERLTESTRADFLNQANNIYFAALDQQMALEDQFRTQGTQIYGLPQDATELVVRDIRATGSVSEAALAPLLQQLSAAQQEELMYLGSYPQ